MKFGYTIIYVSSVVDTLDFYNKAFGFQTKFILESKDWGELSTGDTTLAFATHKMGEINLEGKYHKADMNDMPFGIELSFLTDDVEAAFERAVNAGAVPIREPEEKPWGQVVCYVRSMDGTIIEIATPVPE
ncbi:VOC family protein [Thermodesulfobacteriota bacterium]